MPVVKQALSPKAMNALISIYHKPRCAYEIEQGLCIEMEEARLAKIVLDRGEGEQPELILKITPAGKTRVRKWGG